MSTLFPPHAMAIFHASTTIMSDTQADTRYQPRGDFRYTPYPQAGSQQMQAQGSGGGGGGPRQPSYSSGYPSQYASPSFPLPPLQGSHHFPSPAAPSSQRFPHFQAQPQPLDWHSSSVASGVHLPPIRYQQTDDRTQTQSQSHAQPAHRHPQPTDSGLRNGAWSFPQPPHLARAEHEDARRPMYEPQAGYRSPPRDNWQSHNRTHSQQSQILNSVPKLERNSPGPSDDGTSRHWGGTDDDARSHEGASQVAKEDTDSEEDESGKKKRKRRRKANEAPRDLSQRKYRQVLHQMRPHALGS